MDKLTRKDLKTDKFAQEVTHSLEYVSGHRKQAIMYGAGALALVLAISGILYWRGAAHEKRQAELAEALRIREGVLTVTPQPDDPRLHFPNKDAKDKAMRTAFEGIVNRHAGSDEATVAHFHLGSIDSDNGDLANAEKHFKIVAESGDADLASSGKLSLAQVYQAQGKTADAERILRELLNNPTTVVSKEQATFSLIRLLAASKPDEARKLLEPLQKDERAAVNRNAASLAAELPQTSTGK